MLDCVGTVRVGGLGVNSLEENYKSLYLLTSRGQRSGSGGRATAQAA